MWWRKKGKTEEWIEKLSRWNPLVVRRQAAEKLEKLADAKAVKSLTKALDDEDLTVQFYAVKALGKIGSPAVESLIQALEIRYWNVKWEAIEALGRIGDVRAIEPLRKVLKEYETPCITEMLTKICKSIMTVVFGDGNVMSFNRQTTWINPDISEFTISLPRLKRIVIDPETYNFYQVERFMTYAVSYIGQKYLKKHVEVHIYGNLDKLHPNLRNEFPRLCKSVKAHEGDSIAMIEDKEAMEWRKKENLKGLIYRLEDHKWSTRRDAVKRLGEFGGALVIEPLIGALKDVDPLVRSEAGQALAQVIENTREVEPLIKALKIRNSPFLEKTLEALGKTGDVRAIEPLNKILEEEDERRHIREKAVEALAEIGSPAIESLIKVLGDTYWQVREKAVESLGNIGDPRVIEPLIHELEDEKRNPVQGKAAEILGKIGDTRAVRPLVNALEDENSEVRRKAAESLEMIGLPAIEILTTLHGEKRGNTSDKILEILKNIYASVNTIVLGNTSSKNPNPRTIWYDPDVSELTIPMSNLKRIEMYTESYNVLHVERFMTYAVNYIGQKHLKKHVEVYIYGDPEKLHPNLRNTFKNLCKCVNMHEKTQE